MTRWFFCILAIALSLSACRCFNLPLKRKDKELVSAISEGKTMSASGPDNCEIYEKKLHCSTNFFTGLELAPLNEHELIDVVVFWQHLCVLDTFGKVHCAGKPSTEKFIEQTASFRFDSIKGRYQTFCGHDVDTDMVHCFWSHGRPENIGKRLISGIKAKDYDVAVHNVCIINLKDEIECLPLETGPEKTVLEVPSGKYDRVFATGTTVCGQRDGQVKCTEAASSAMSLKSHFAAIEARHWRKVALAPGIFCGIDEEARGHCLTSREKPILPDEPLVDIAAGIYSVCFKKTHDGRMECIAINRWE